MAPSVVELRVLQLYFLIGSYQLSPNQTQEGQHLFHREMGLSLQLHFQRSGSLKSWQTGGRSVYRCFHDTNTVG